MINATYRNLQEAEEYAKRKFPGESIGDGWGSRSARVQVLQKLLWDVETASDGEVDVAMLRRDLAQLAVACTMWLDVEPDVEVTHG